MLKTLIILFVIVFSLIYVSGYFVQYREVENDFDMFQTSDPELCKSWGGELQPVCISQADACVITYFDAGKLCSSSSECQGRCLYLENLKPVKMGAEVQGVCESTNNPCGCWSIVEKGELFARGCID